MPSFESLRGTVAQLYNEPDARVDLVATGLRKARVDKVIGDTNVDRLSALSTVSGVLEEGGRLCPSLAEKVEEAKPLLAKASEKEGRQELISQAFTTASDLSAPYIEQAKPYVAKAAPYLEKLGMPSTTEEFEAQKEALVAKSVATKDALVAKKEALVAKKDALVAKSVATKDALLADKRLQKVLELIKDVKEHPREAAVKLKDEAISLIQYDRCQQYREAVQNSTEAYMTATAKLLQEELPAVAKEATRVSATRAQEHAAALRTKLKEFIATHAYLRAKVAEAPHMLNVLMERYLTEAQIGRLNEIRSQAEELVTFARSQADSRAPYCTKQAEMLYSRMSVVLGDLWEPTPLTETAADDDESAPPSPFSFTSGPGPFEPLANPAEEAAEPEGARTAVSPAPMEVEDEEGVAAAADEEAVAWAKSPEGADAARAAVEVAAEALNKIDLAIDVLNATDVSVTVQPEEAEEEEAIVADSQEPSMAPPAELDDEA